jgi:hypothetical protein
MPLVIDEDKAIGALDRELLAGVEDDRRRLQGDRFTPIDDDLGPLDGEDLASFDDDLRRLEEFLVRCGHPVAGAIPVERIPADDVRLLPVGQDARVPLDVDVVVLVHQMLGVAELLAVLVDAAVGLVNAATDGRHRAAVDLEVEVALGVDEDLLLAGVSSKRHSL